MLNATPWRDDMEPDTKAADTESKSLPKELDPLVEALAQGNERDIAVKTLQRILALGYRIEPPISRALPGRHSSIHSPVSEFLERLKAPNKLNISELLQIRTSLSSADLLVSSEVYEQLGNRILKAGEPILAYDVTTRGIQVWPTSVRLTQLMALSLARSGATARASRILIGLYHEGHRDGETLGILARTHKDLAEQTADASERIDQMRRAQAIYSEAYSLVRDSERLDDAIYTGINAASTALLTGVTEEATRIAREVRELCRLKLSTEKDYWAQASLGEASIILSEWEEAEDWYSRAGQTGRGNFGDLSSTRRQARLLLGHLDMDRTSFDHCFRIPNVVLFSGRMTESNGRSELPSPSLEDVLRRRITENLKTVREKICYCGVTCGSDIIFLEEMARQNSEINIILPFPASEFEKAGRDIIPGGQWQERFRKVLEKAANVVVSSEHGVEGSRIICRYANLMRDGLALLRARILDTEVLPMVVVDGGDGSGSEAISSEARYWHAQGLIPRVLDLGECAGPHAAIPNGAGKTNTGVAESIAGAPDFPQQIAALLIADVAGYSSLTEEQFPRFAKHFLGTVADLIAQLPHALLAKNTWGDALYLVFGSVDEAGRFALDLLDRLSGALQGEGESTGELNLRVALHAGPVFTWTDPVIERSSATGWHVVRAARIEPITPPGQVYASQAFAALAAAEGIRHFACDYVGEIPMAKKFGTYPTYHVRRTS